MARRVITGWKRFVIGAGIDFIYTNKIYAHRACLLPGAVKEVVLGVVFAKGASAGPCSSCGCENSNTDKNDFELFHDYKFRRFKSQ